jgi:ComF family protein
LEAVFARSHSAVLFRGGARSLVVELKYHRALHVLEDIEEMFRRSPLILSQVRGAVLIPVPLHPRKQRERGFNQSEGVAMALARAAGGGTRSALLLRRIVDTPSQTACDRPSRETNLKNAFALAPGANLNSHLRYILVDDVFTTGSTLNSCARSLRRAGALNIEAAAFAHG